MTMDKFTRMIMDKFTLFDDSKYENHTANELHLEGSSSEGLKEAAKQYIKDCVALKFPTSDAKLRETDIRAAFLAGAEWQKEKDVRDMLMSDCRNFEKCYELGKKDMREQMMDKACEWLGKNADTYIGVEGYAMLQDKFFEDFRKAMGEKK